MHLYLNLHRSCQAWVICRILSIKVIFIVHTTSCHCDNTLSVMILEMAGLRLDGQGFFIARFILYVILDAKWRSNQIRQCDDACKYFQGHVFLFVCIGMNSNCVVSFQPNAFKNVFFFFKFML